MKREKKRRFLQHTGDRITFWVLVGIMATTLVISALRGIAGLALVDGGLYLYLPLSLVLIAVGWGLSAVFRRLKKPALRGIFGTLMVLVMLGLLTIGMTYASFAAGLSFPHRYVSMTAPDGVHRLIVMRMLDPDETRIEQRRQARLSSNPDGDEKITAEDWGYVYTAYAPGPLDLFYRVDSLMEGEVYIGYASNAELMVEWEDAIGHFYIKNPETGDSGEMRARCN